MASFQKVPEDRWLSKDLGSFDSVEQYRSFNFKFQDMENIISKLSIENAKLQQTIALNSKKYEEEKKTMCTQFPEFLKTKGQLKDLQVQYDLSN